MRMYVCVLTWSCDKLHAAALTAAREMDICGISRLADAVVTVELYRIHLHKRRPTYLVARLLRLD